MEKMPTPSIGSLDEERKEYNGLFGMLQRADIDALVTDLTITRTRSQYMDFPMPIHDYEYSPSRHPNLRRNLDAEHCSYDH